MQRNSFSRNCTLLKTGQIEFLIPAKSTESTEIVFLHIKL